MLYRNKVTGAIVDTSSAVGGVWEPVDAPAPAKPAEVKKPAPVKKPVRKTTKK